MSIHLSPRQQQITDRVQQAKSNKQIAFELGLSEGTVRGYLFRLFKKTAVDNRTGLAISAWQDKLAACQLDGAETVLQLRAAFAISWAQAKRDHDEMQAALDNRNHRIVELNQQIREMQARC
jgi:DNA-binding CsgD family transcriptional regulator